MEPLTQSDYHSLVLSRLTVSDFDLIETKLQPVFSTGFTVFADFSVLTISIKLKSREDVSELSFIVKTPPKNKTCADFVARAKAFSKEPLIYNGVLKDLSVYVTGKLGPDCFLSHPEKVIVFDNIFDLGYRKRDIKKEYNITHCELVLEALAKLHAGSLILEETKCIKLPEEYKDVFYETLFSDETDHPGFDFMCTGINTLENLLTTHFTHFPRSVIKDTMTMIRNLPFKLKPSEDFRNVFSHGGVWSENALFDYGIDGLPVDVRLINFNNARYAPPALDVLLFLHLTTSRAFREIHQGALLTQYYVKLGKEVQARGSDLAELLPWAEFEASVQHYLGVAIIAALLYIHVTQLPEDALDAVTKDPNTLAAFMYEDRSERVLSAYSYDETYRRRLNQALVQALEYTQFRGRRRSSVYVSA